MTKLAVAGFAAVALLLAAGCGGKSRNKAYVSSKADYASALDQICGPAQSAIQNLQPRSIPQIVERGRRIRDIIERAVDRIDRLEPPDEVRTAAEDFITKSRTQIDRIDELVDAAKSANREKVQEIGGELAELDKATDADARAIGAQRCVSPQ